jgi:hypothetical protein
LISSIEPVPVAGRERRSPRRSITSRRARRRPTAAGRRADRHDEAGRGRAIDAHADAAELPAGVLVEAPSARA